MKFLSFFLAALIAFAPPASAGKISKVGKGYVVYQTFKKAKKIKQAATTLQRVNKIRKAVDGNRAGEVAREITDDIVRHTRRSPSHKQRQELVDTLSNRPATPTMKELEQARRSFSRDKENYIREWERRMGQKWPSTDREIRNERGDVLVGRDTPYDAHHIFPLELGSKNSWTNITPAQRPMDHQAGIHAAGSALRLLSKILK